ncbi:MAG TPA: hypothetical protein VFB24_12785 [Candidatus Binatia bacterium]|nr:hypothetical protein [Candidatus Binatia bacterium]
MKTWLVRLLLSITIFATHLPAQTAAALQTATVVSIDKVAADARHPEKGDQYKIAVRMGNTVYMCHGSGPAAAFLDWSPGKEFPAKLSDKILQVTSPNGQVVDLNIVGKKTPK